MLARQDRIAACAREHEVQDDPENPGHVPVRVMLSDGEEGTGKLDVEYLEGGDGMQRCLIDVTHDVSALSPGPQAIVITVPIAF